jgi:hypothetical protein
MAILEKHKSVAPTYARIAAVALETRPAWRRVDAESFLFKANEERIAIADTAFLRDVVLPVIEVELRHYIGRLKGLSTRREEELLQLGHEEVRKYFGS